jgi:predicted amidohydrolase
MKVAHDKQKNLETYRKFIKQAARKDCKLIAFPECSLQGYTWSWDPVGYKYTEDAEQLRYFQETSETVPGPSTNLLGELAAKHEMYIQFGLAEKADDSNIFNTAALVGPEGFIGKFRKVHMGINSRCEFRSMRCVCGSGS